MSCLPGLAPDGGKTCDGKRNGLEDIAPIRMPLPHSLELSAPLLQKLIDYGATKCFAVFRRNTLQKNGTQFRKIRAHERDTGVTRTWPRCLAPRQILCGVSVVFLHADREIACDVAAECCNDYTVNRKT